MNNKDSDTIQFEEENSNNLNKDSIQANKDKQDPEDNKVFRRAYRTPVSPSDPISVKIGNKSYTVGNITNKGIQIYFSEKEEFQSNQELDTIELIIENHSMSLKGRTVYIAQEDLETYSCGIDFNPYPQNEQHYPAIKNFIDKKHQELFT